MLSNESQLNMQRSSDMMNEPWYVEAINSTNPALTSARMQKFSMDKDKWVISMSQEVKDENNRNLGVVLLDIEYKGIGELFERFGSGEQRLCVHYQQQRRNCCIIKTPPILWIPPSRRSCENPQDKEGLMGNNLCSK